MADLTEAERNSLAAMLAKLAAREATRRWGRMQDVADILHSEEQSDREKQET